MDVGALSVLIPGMPMMQLWFASNWDFLQQVCLVIGVLRHSKSLYATSDLANFTHNINIIFQCRFLTYMLASTKHIKTFHYKVVMSYMLETMI